jgi:nucleoside-triphosphatase
MKKSKTYIISGNSGDGKTSLLISTIKKLQQKGLKISGFYAEGKWDQNTRIGFDLVDIESNNKIELCSTKFHSGWNKEGRFYFNPKAIAMGNNILANLQKSKPYLIVIDEIGQFELNGKIWANSFRNLLNSTTTPIIITAKQKLISKITSSFQINQFEEIPSNTNINDFINRIEEQ